RNLAVHAVRVVHRGLHQSRGGFELAADRADRAQHLLGGNGHRADAGGRMLRAIGGAARARRGVAGHGGENLRRLAQLLDICADGAEHAVNTLAKLVDRALDGDVSLFVFGVDDTLLFGAMALGDVVDRRQPAAVGERPADVLYNATVVEL